MAFDESEILRRAQRLSAPTRRALSSGLEKALMSTRYQDNPNVASMITRKALSGYGEGLSSAVSAGEREATDIMSREEQTRLEQERINMQREAYSDQSDAATVSGVTQLGMLGLMGYDAYNKWGGTIPAVSGVGSAGGVGSAVSGAAGVGAAGAGLSTMTSGALAAQTGLTQAGLHTVLGDAAFTGELVNTGGLAAGAGTALGVGALALAPVVLGPTLAKGMKSLSQSLGMGGQSHNSATEYISQYLDGKETSQYGDDVAGLATNTKALESNLAMAMYGPTFPNARVPSELLNAVQSRDKDAIISFFKDHIRSYDVEQAMATGQTNMTKLLEDYGRNKMAGSQQWESLYGGG